MNKEERKDVATPNDPKLSDSVGWRGYCAVGLLGAVAVTAVVVRCSAWLGDGSFWDWRGIALVLSVVVNFYALVCIFDLSNRLWWRGWEIKKCKPNPRDNKKQPPCKKVSRVMPSRRVEDPIFAQIRHRGGWSQ